MLQQNVEVVRRFFQTYATGAEAWADTLDPAVRWHVLEERHALVLGREAVVRAQERWLEAFDAQSYRDEVEELMGQGENVLAAVRIRGRGRRSGIPVDNRVYLHFKVRDGKIVYCYEYETRDEALEAAGLGE